MWLHPIFAAGAKDAAKYWATGSYTMSGYFTGRSVNYPDWLAERDEPADEDARANGEIGPEFCVETWCYAPSRQVGSDKYLLDVERDAAAEMRKDRAPLCGARHQSTK